MDDILKDKKTKSNEVVIDIKDLNKTFKIHSDRKQTLRQLVTGLFNQGKVEEFHALRDINLQIKRGEFVGIIGRNGSGKSTLLKIIAGIYAADKGSSVKVKGKIVPFLELGVGFNHDLSGRENIYLNGTILGMPKDFLDKKFKEIVEFAELEEFIDEPVKNYSSGMLVRLAFSIAIQADADIYILDEVLAVGDVGFQKKCMRIIRNLKKEGKTILYVSHSTGDMEKLADLGILLNNGKLHSQGSMKMVLDSYMHLTKERADKPKKKTIGRKREEEEIKDYEIDSVKVFNSEGEETKTVNHLDRVEIRLYLSKRKDENRRLNYHFAIHSAENNVVVAVFNTLREGIEINISDKNYVSVYIDKFPLTGGKYFFSSFVFGEIAEDVLDIKTPSGKFEVLQDQRQQTSAVVSIEHEWQK